MILNIDIHTALNLLIERVKDVFERYRCDCILLSAGIDTSFLATVAVRELRHRLTGIVALYSRGVPKDIYWSNVVSRVLGVDLYAHIFTDTEALDATDKVVSILKTFDPMEVRNDITIAISLRKARELGCRCIYTGDAGDELFAGYSYMAGMTYGELSRYISDLATYMEFSSHALDSYFGVEVVSPYSEEGVRDLALELPPYCRIPIDDPRRLNKYILRIYLEKQNIPTYIREKNPIEYGSSSTMVARLWESMVRDEDMEIVSRYFRPRSREQAYLLKRYLELVGWEEYSDVARDKPRCRYCGAPLLRPRSRYCRRCGSYPAI